MPGQPAQRLMTPIRREHKGPEEKKAGEFRPSAVMILLCRDDEDSFYIPLIERMPYHGVHSSQISLPGGKFDKEDENLEHTATRECFEEIGVGDVEVIGQLTELHISVSGFLVQPFVGYCRTENPVIQTDEREVKSILKLKVEDLLDEGIIENGVIEVIDRYRITAPWFNIEGHRVWGATAMILSELKEVMKTIS